MVERIQLPNYTWKLLMMNGCHNITLLGLYSATRVSVWHDHLYDYLNKITFLAP